MVNEKRLNLAVVDVKLETTASDWFEQIRFSHRKTEITNQNAS